MRRTIVVADILLCRCVYMALLWPGDSKLSALKSWLGLIEAHQPSCLKVFCTREPILIIQGSVRIEHWRTMVPKEF